MLAAWVLYNMEDPASVPALEAALNQESEKMLRHAYIRALGAVGEESAGALARLIDSRDPEVREVVVNALAGRAGGPWPWPSPRPRPFP
jgi:HEAT repeat protein